MIGALMAAAIALTSAGTAQSGDVSDEDTTPGTASEPSEDLIDAAREEGSLTWYTSMLLEQEAQPLAEAFENEYGVSVEIFRAGGADTIARFSLEADAGITNADVVSASDPVAYNTWARDGLLEAYFPSGFEHVPSFARHEDGYWVASLLRMTVIGYRSDIEDPEEMPTSWLDLGDPRYAGRVVIGDPAFSGATAALWAMLTRDYGFEYIEALEANDTLVVQGAGALNDMVLIGERSIGGNMGLEIIHGMQVDGAAVEAVIPEEGAFSVPTATAVAANAAHPNAAKLFADFLVSKAGQEVLVSIIVYPARLDIAPPEGLPSYEELTLYEADWEYFEEAREEFVDRFSEIFG